MNDTSANNSRLLKTIFDRANARITGYKLVLFEIKLLILELSVT